MGEDLEILSILTLHPSTHSAKVTECLLRTCQALRGSTEDLIVNETGKVPIREAHRLARKAGLN